MRRQSDSLNDGPEAADTDSIRLTFSARQDDRGPSITAGRSSVALSLAEAARGYQNPVADPTHPRELNDISQSLQAKVWQQIITFNPLQSAFLDLYFDIIN